MGSTPQYTSPVFSDQPVPGSNPRPIPAARTPYVDTGCVLNPSCLDCKLPLCVHDMTPAQLAQLRLGSGGLDTAARVQELLERGISRTAAIAMLAAQDSVGGRAIYHRLHDCQGNPPPSPNGSTIQDHSRTAFCASPKTSDGKEAHPCC